MLNSSVLNSFILAIHGGKCSWNHETLRRERFFRLKCFPHNENSSFKRSSPKGYLGNVTLTHPFECTVIYTTGPISFIKLLPG